jgi:transposase-like protein
VSQQARAVRHNMNLPKLIHDFGSENACRVYLRELRWPNGVRCPRCDSTSISKIGWPDDPMAKGRRQFDCGSCRYRFSVTAGTVFHDSHLALSKWFLATYLMCEARKGVSANQLKRTLAVPYETAWFLCHRIRSAMDEASPEMLAGIVEADETYVGGKPRYKAKSKKEAARRRMENKTVVLGALERDGQLRVRVVKDVRHGTVHGFLGDVVADEAEAIYTDSHTSYRGIGDDDTRHEFVDHSAEEWVREDVTTNGIESAWSLLKRSIVGSYHQLSAKHLQAYADEFAFRFNNRENPFLFRDTLLRLISANALPYRDLTGASSH